MLLLFSVLFGRMAGAFRIDVSVGRFELSHKHGQNEDLDAKLDRVLDALVPRRSAGASSAIGHA